MSAQSNVPLNNEKANSIPVRGRRLKSYWEPFYKPKIKDKFIEHNWNFDNDTGPKYSIFNAERLGQNRRIDSVRFTDCDFSGEFEKPVYFVDCTFDRCDLGLSKFVRAKFTRCRFTLTSFTQCTLVNSELRDCIYDRIGFSGNETQIEGTLITNPDFFVTAAYTNVLYLPTEKSWLIQKLRLEETKSTFSRAILANLTNEGSDVAFYSAVRISTIQECRAKIAIAIRSIIEACTFKEGNSLNLKWYSRLWKGLSGVLSFFGGVIDWIILHAFGLLNGWGASLARPVAIGAIIMFGYGYSYHHYFGAELWQGVKKATEIMLLFGYTAYFNPSSPCPDSNVVFSNALIGVLWYIVTVPTIVNKLTRIRG